MTAHINENADTYTNVRLRWVAVEGEVALGILTAKRRPVLGSEEAETYTYVEIIYNASDVRRVGFDLAVRAKADGMKKGQPLYRTGVATEKGESTLEEAGIEISPDAKASSFSKGPLAREKAIALGDSALQSAADDLGLKVWT
ncbi:hypothetical protein [Rhodococcus sp. ARC_M6]|uniref:hypothetical protein n=1 Tax=Rhodococcus sp. ARC_M6 TaxID=2928852 RepID=UPI001FB507CC|nr:hypothetical protein [Rhodococcus sp. ARC_M6]MCJ0906241.1 hypothetical protein [Rhodococcus sp. ARC_M6]